MCYSFTKRYIPYKLKEENLKKEDQQDATIRCLLLTCLNMFRASLCPSSGEQRPCYCIWCVVRNDFIYSCLCGPGSSVRIATDYGLDGPGSNPGGDEIFRPSRPALGPAQPPAKWVSGLSRGKVRSERAADHSPPSSAAVMEEWSYTSTHPLGHTGPVTGSIYLTFTFLPFL